MTIAQAIERVLAGYIADGLVSNAEQVNHGLCEDFAEDVCCLISGAKAWWDDELAGDDSFGRHKVIRFRGMYYDSQCPEGRRDWRKLIRGI